MLKYETEHYIFNYRENSPAERDIGVIARGQEECWSRICETLCVSPPFRLKYFLCETPEEVGRIYGDNEPCNGFAAPPDTIYAVYNDSVKCTGPHEDAHIISYCVNRPPSAAVREGLAMFFDEKWLGRDNILWTAEYIRNGKYVPINELFDDDTFFSYSDALTYPIAGEFAKYLINAFGIGKYMEFYRFTDSAAEAFGRVYKASPAEADKAFVRYVLGNVPG